MSWEDTPSTWAKPPSDTGTTERTTCKDEVVNSEPEYPWRLDTNDRYREVVALVMSLATAALLLPVFLIRDFLGIQPETTLRDIFSDSLYWSWGLLVLSIVAGIMFGSPKVHVGPELAEGAPGGPVTGAFPGFSLGVLVMGQGPVEARGKRAVFSKARWARLCVRGAGSFHRACPFVTSGPRGALLHLPRVQLVKSRCPYDLRCTCVILQPERWGPNSQTLAPLRVRAHRGDHAL